MVAQDATTLLDAGTITIRWAGPADRDIIYRIRHEVYAKELAQHPPREDGRLTDRLDTFNLYLVADVGTSPEGRLAGFVSVTPPSLKGYSLDKYVPRGSLPFVVNEGLFEVRLLTVREPFRRLHVAHVLMLAALRAVEGMGGTAIAAIGRRELMSAYQDAGLQPTGQRVTSGAVTFEVMHARTDSLRARADRFLAQMTGLASRIAWPPLPSPSGPATHGGKMYEALGDRFQHLSADVVPADILDAWFPPAPRVLATLKEHLAWAASSSPPTHAEGLESAVAEVRGLPRGSVLAGHGSSNLIHEALRTWVQATSRVLLPDPTYSEYGHVLGRLGCQVERLPLEEAQGFALTTARLREALRTEPDWVVLVNPNNPTGQVTDPAALADLVASHPRTRFWVDETYVDFAGSPSLERQAATSTNLVVCKSLSKAYSLSGLRVGYLCASPAALADLRAKMPPWSVSTIAQMAAIVALGEEAYYSRQWHETGIFREELAGALRRLGLSVHGDAGNFLLCRLPEQGPTARQVIEAAAAKGVLLRDVHGMGSTLGERHLRVAVRSVMENERIVDALRQALHAAP